MTPARPSPLLPFPLNPTHDPVAWRAAHTRGRGAIAAIGPLAPAGPEPVGPWATELIGLAAAGVRPFGHVSLAYGARPAAEVRAEILRWARMPIVGLFLDHAPSGPFHLGPAIDAVRTARRAGIATIILNPGTSVEPAYRRLSATVCTFEGSWAEYLGLPERHIRLGDGHLVYDVPRADLSWARELATARGAGLVLVTEQPAPEPGAPLVGAGSAGTRTTSGS